MYCIYNKKRDMFCRWNESTIIFDTKEQCNEFIKAIPSFFNDEMDYVHILPITEEMKKSVKTAKKNIGRRNVSPIPSAGNHWMIWNIFPYLF